MKEIIESGVASIYTFLIAILEFAGIIATLFVVGHFYREILVGDL